MKSFHEIGAYVIDYIITTGPSVLLAIAVLFAGLFIIKRFTRRLERQIIKRHIERSLAYFLTGFLRLILVSLLVVSVASMLGIATSSVVAVLGAAGLAIGLALQGSLANFAGGMLILFFQPFKVGEHIGVDNVEGLVMRIDILHTTLSTMDNQMVVLPNGPMANAVIFNYSRNNIRRAEMTVGISPEIDTRMVKAAILQVLQNDPLILQDPAPEVFIKSLDIDAVELIIHCWSNIADYLDMCMTIMEKIKTELDKLRISAKATLK